MGIHVSGNPHKKQPYRDLWDKGWRLERKKEDLQRNPNRPPFKKTPEAVGSTTDHRKPRFFKRKAEPQKPTAPGTERLVARFNRRRTTV